MVNYSALELGKVLGGNIRKTDSYRDDFLENEELLDLLLGNLHNINVNAYYRVLKNILSGTFRVEHPVYGEVGVYQVGFPWIMGHPVYGELGEGILGVGEYDSIVVSEGDL